MKPLLDFWFDFASTYSYLAAGRIGALASEHDVEVRYRPFLLGPNLAAQGWQDSPFNIYETKGRYMWRDMERQSQRYGLPLRRPTTFPRNSVLAARVAIVGVEQGFAPRFVRATFAANFEYDRDIASVDVLGAVLAECGVDAKETLAAAEDAEHRPLLRAQSEQAARLGIFGAPTFVAAGEIFWGNDRLDEALRWAKM